ncbi:MAG: TonB-dependent receptor [Cyclobacteriaceae bacterium]|nr:TonB-dependent receptor [Cyclobacteriaceae bacterium]
MKHKILYSGIMVLAIFLFHIKSAAQPFTVSGIVTSQEDQEPLPGANVVVKGTSNGTITSIDGSFSLSIDNRDALLVISSVGFVKQEIPVGAQTQFNIALQSDVTALDEVVVVGYGTQKKEDVLGSISAVKSEQLMQVPAPSFVAGLQGQAAGVYVSSSSGVPGAKESVKIRGVNSISSGTDPLWIVDGMPVYSGGGLEDNRGSTGQDPMSLINPNDIASIEILKDAAATAIYGSRGSNGVIIITTKSGKNGKGGFAVDYTGGMSDLTTKAKDIGFANTSEWFGLVEEARKNSNGGVENPYDPLSITGLFKDDPTYHLSRQEALLIDTDWFDQILRIGTFHEINASATGGGDKSSYFLSGNYRLDNSVLKNSDLSRITLRVNLDFSPVNNLDIGTRLSFSSSQNSRQKVQAGGGIGSNGGGTQGGFGNANRNALTWYPIYNSNHRSGYWNPLSGNNLVANIDPDLMLDDVQQYRGLGNVFMEYHLPWVDGLSLRSEVSFDLIQNNSVFWVTETLRELGSYATDKAVTRNSINYNLYAKYLRNFGENHNINIVAGTESQETKQYTRNAQGQNLTGTYQELGSPQEMLSIYAGLNGEGYLRSFFGRVNYKFKDKYMLGLSFRRDGSSKFDSEFRWGTFTAFSAGWLLSEENFLTGVKMIESLKLRGSYGQTGNNDIPGNKTITTYENRSDWRYGPLDQINGGTRITNIGNPTLTWETTNSYDVGIDYGLFNNKLSGSVAWYMQDVSDLLLSSPLTPSSGVNNANFWNNIGDMKNYGFEFNARSINLHTKWGLRWVSDFNITTNDNKVVRLTPDVDRAGAGIINESKISRTGGRLWAYFMAEDAGVDPEKGVNMIWEIDYDHYLATGETLKTGRKVPATSTNLQRNRIIHNDKTEIPRFYGGLNNTLTYKGFDFSLFFNFAMGSYLYDYDEQRTTDVQYGQVILRKILIDNTWTPERPDAEYPELRWQGSYDWGWDTEVENPESPTGKGNWIQGTGNYKNEGERWTKYLHQANYLRLRTVQLGYNLPKPSLDKIRLKGLRVYVTGTNLWTWSTYKGWDPETGGAVIPPLKMLSGGVSIKF